MKVVHTSDWHLGQSLMKFSREAEHRAFIDFLVETVRREDVDTLILAGDVFDTATPGSQARELYVNAMCRLKDAGIVNLVVVAGNHDSVAVLEENREVLQRIGVRVVASAPQSVEDLVLDLLDREGRVAGLFCAVPFLRQRDLLTSVAGQDAGARQEAMREAIAGYYRRAYDEALRRRGDAPLPILASAHLATVGGRLSESVRDIYIGTLDAFPAAGFPPFDYLALGHLHRAQTVAGNPRFRYSGAPIPMSFDEVDQGKVLVEVTFTAGEVQIREIPLPVFQRLVSLRGPERRLLETCEALARGGESVWLNLEVEGEVSVLSFRQRLEAVLGSSAVAVLCLRRVRAESVAVLTRQRDELLQHLGPREVFRRLLEDRQIDSDSGRTLEDAFSALLSTLQDGADEGIDPALV